MLSSTFLLLLLFTTFPSSIEAVLCGENGVCIAASMFDANNIKADKQKQKTKSCDDGCAVFTCVVDKKKVMAGSGCYSDYEKVCKYAPADAKFDVKEINADPVVKKAPNYLVVACNTLNCVLRSPDEVGDFFSNQFLDGIDNSFTDTCEYPEDTEQPSTITKTSSDSSGLMNQMDGFKLFGMILCGFFLLNFGKI